MVREWIWFLRRWIFRQKLRRRGGHPLVWTVTIALLLSAGLISFLELRLRPVAAQLAIRQVHNRVTAQLDQALYDVSVDYDKLVQLQQDDAGTVLAITSDPGQVNLLRARVSTAALEAIAAVDVHTMGVPLGSLFELDLLWALGPTIRVRSLTAGTVSTHVRSEFLSAGINQTLHRILVDVTVPLTVLLPGDRANTQVSTTVCLAETVVVGRVPETYLNWSGNIGLQTGDRTASP